MEAAHPTGNQGDAYLVGGDIYMWNPDTNAWEKVGSLIGPTGPTGPAGSENIQLNSIDTARLQSNVNGTRIKVCAIGLGFSEVNNSTADPITLTSKRTIPIKMLTGGTITGVLASFCTNDIQTDVETDVFAQLYYATGFDTTQFQPVPNTLFNVGTIPYLAGAGTLRTANISDISFQFDAGTQFIIGFYNTSNLVTSGNDVFLSGVLNVE